MILRLTSLPKCFPCLRERILLLAFVARLSKWYGVAFKKPWHCCSVFSVQQWQRRSLKSLEHLCSVWSRHVQHVSRTPTFLTSRWQFQVAEDMGLSPWEIYTAQAARRYDWLDWWGLNFGRDETYETYAYEHAQWQLWQLPPQELEFCPAEIQRDREAVLCSFVARRNNIRCTKLCCFKPRC